MASSAAHLRRADVHFHILPAVDDGPGTVDESLELAELALRDRTTTVVATPHVRDVDLDEIPERVAALRRRLAERGLPLELRCGGELAHDDVGSATQVQLSAIAQGPPEARWLLLEAPLPHAGATVEELRDAADELRGRGFGVLVGHPERCSALFDDDAAALQAEIAHGSVLQVNATSLTGVHGATEQARSLELVRAGLPAIVASDAHRPTRGPALGAARAALLAAGVPEAVARDMTDVAPRAILERGLCARSRVAAR
jgi:protein-tyrosine phosphatase